MAAKKKNTAVDLPSQADPRAPLDGALLLSKAQGLLAELEADLLARARGSAPVREALRLRHEAERGAKRTADPLEVWERHFVTQVAASWLLSCVFVRTLEDRGLLGHNRIAGPGATDSQRLFFELAPSLTEREYLLTVFRELSRLPAARDLFDARHNPVWMLGPSAEIAKKLLALFRAPSAEGPGLRFGQPDTRFLGDLYQDLSADVRERFALLQTPHFVEKYILDRTLERAIATFGLDETTLIDPTCGSGHFLLGAFERLVDHRLRKEPGLDVREAARKALDAVYGADINPYAVAIARFRLTLAFLDKAGYARVADAPALPLHLVVADSLLHAPQLAQSHLGDVAGTSKASWAGSEFALEDEVAAKEMLFRRYAAVVGNPPYITVKDAVLRERYREMYPRSAAGKYSLGAPFTERFFLLAKSAGFVGMITANSFMKREFGKKLIEQFLPTVNLDGVANTSGAYIPGHGTPTVLLFGTNEPKQGDDVLTVLAKRGEPSTPADPEQGFVWRSIADHGSEVGFENDYVSVARVARTTLERHPWSLGGGGAAELKELLEERAACRLGEMVDNIGIASFTLEDEVYLRPAHVWHRMLVPERVQRPMIIGEAIRDWSVGEVDSAFFPYDEDFKPLQADDASLSALWPHRTNLANNMLFGGKTKVQGGLAWYEFGRLTADKLRTPLTITFAFVATHNHFVLDRGGKVFKQSAPIIKLKEGASEEDHLALLAYLNSSTACFWMKQVMMDKGATSDRGVLQADPEKFRFEFDGTKMATVPVPVSFKTFRSGLLEAYGKRLAEAGETLCNASFENVIVKGEPSGALERVARFIAERDELRGRMVAWQEELDWLVYELYGLLTDGGGGRAADDPDKVASRGADERAYRVATADAARARVIASQPGIALIERPEFKRRWFRSAGAFDADNVTDDMLIDRASWSVLRAKLEALFHAPVIARLSELTRGLAADADATAAGIILRREIDKSLTSEALAGDGVPFLAAFRHSEAGLEKRAEWERVWDLQRAEDRGEKLSPFDPPPKYDQKDYRDANCWRLRGKLDVPNERFISYPGCESDEDKEPIYGWAGWNHLQQAQALAALYQKRKTEETWGKERLTPMLAGLLELIPWVKQWHNEPSAEFGGLRLGDYFETFLDGECHALGLTREDLRAWRPAEKTRGKAAKKAKAPSEAADAEAAEGASAPPKTKRTKAKKTAAPADAGEGE